MSHKEQIDYIKKIKKKFPDKFKNKKVLDVGSLDLNGSIKPFFEDCEYTGVDVGPGKNVDVVSKGEDLDFPDGSFDVVASCECFEHNPNYKETFRNMVRMLKPSGLLIMTCATIGRPVHGTQINRPNSNPLNKTNYYKNLEESDIRKFFDLGSSFEEHSFKVEDSNHDLNFYGIKKK